MTHHDDPLHDAFVRGAWAGHERICRAALRAPDLLTLVEALYTDMTAHDHEWWATSGLPAAIVGRRQVLLSDLVERLTVLRGLAHWPNPDDLLPVCPESVAELTRGTS